MMLKNTYLLNEDFLQNSHQLNFLTVGEVTDI